MTVESDLRCDLCGLPLPSLTEEWIMKYNQKYELIMIGKKGNEKFLCKNCVLDVLHEAKAVDLIDWPKKEAGV